MKLRQPLKRPPEARDTFPLSVAQTETLIFYTAPERQRMKSLCMAEKKCLMGALAMSYHCLTESSIIIFSVTTSPKTIHYNTSSADTLTELQPDDKLNCRRLMVKQKKYLKCSYLSLHQRGGKSQHGALLSVLPVRALEVWSESNVMLHSS